MSHEKPMMCGGFTGSNAPTQEVCELAAKHKEDAEAKLGKTFSKWMPVAHKTQVVAGVNHDIKIDAGSEFVKIRIYEPLPGQGETQLSQAQGGLTADSAF